MAKKTIGSRELKTRLGTYLSEVREGATLVITDRGKPVAELSPLHRSENELEARLEELESLGFLTRASGGSLEPFEPIRIEGRSASEAILDERRDRF